MRTLRRHLRFRVALVALLMVSWIIFTNHCALGMMRPMAVVAKEAGACCGGKTDPRHGPPVNLSDCCNIRAITAPAKTEVKLDVSEFKVQLFVLFPLLAAPRTEPRSAGLIFDHGPPQFLTFAESVLQRSLLSHAPPFAV